MSDLVAGPGVEVVEAGELAAGAGSGVGCGSIDGCGDGGARCDGTLTTGQGFGLTATIGRGYAVCATRGRGYAGVDRELDRWFAAEDFADSRNQIATEGPPQVFQAEVLRNRNAEDAARDGIFDAAAEPELKPLRADHAGECRAHLRHDLHIVPGHLLVHACAQS
jgi:hypothetical protein